MIVACFLPLVQQMISKKICARRKNCLKQHFWWQVDVSHSPRKFKLKDVVTFWGNKDWKMINLESLESPFVVPLMITCPNDNIQLVSTSIPNSIQENESFIINLEKLSNWKGVCWWQWTLKGSRFRSYSVKNDGDGRVVALNKTGRKHTNIVVCWTPNVCMSCPNFTLEQRKVPNKSRQRILQMWSSTSGEHFF